MNKEVVKELIQNDVSAENIAAELKRILPGQERRKNVLADYRNLKSLLEFQGNASDNAAALIIEVINN